MKLSEAYITLELPTTATPEEAKKRFKKLAGKFHPDINKSPDAEAKFKRINEAYQIIESGNDTEPQQAPDWNSHFRNAGQDSFATFFRNANKRQHFAANIEIQATISFRDSAQGCKKEIAYSRQTKCPHCQGSGNKPINNGCKKCGGKGQVTTRSQGSIFIQTCPDCGGKSQTSPCNDCNSAGVLNADMSVNVSIPAGIIDGNILRIQGKGNFAGSLMGLQDQYSDVFLHLKVTPDPDMSLVNGNVVSQLNISLLDALQGCSKNIRTIDGDKTVQVEKTTKNKDEIILSVGDHNKIKHRIIVNVSYPTNIDKLVSALLEEDK